MGKMSGQANSSTRMEVAGTIIAMQRAIPLRIAADGKAMIDKAMKMKEVAIDRTKDRQAAWWPTKNPMGKSWGMQKDGDLLKILWEGMLTRGPETITWEKVKGHAAQKHIEQGLATAETKQGNDWADHYATKGIEAHQPQAVRLAKWLANRQKEYAKFIGKIQNIIAVLKKEKEQREYNDEVKNLLHEYDTNKHAMVTCRLSQLQDDNSTTHEVKLCHPSKEPMHMLRNRNSMSPYITSLPKESGCNQMKKKM